MHVKNPTDLMLFRPTTDEQVKKAMASDEKGKDMEKSKTPGAPGDHFRLPMDDDRVKAALKQPNPFPKSIYLI